MLIVIDKLLFTNSHQIKCLREEMSTLSSSTEYSQWSLDLNPREMIKFSKIVPKVTSQGTVCLQNFHKFTHYNASYKNLRLTANKTAVVLTKSQSKYILLNHIVRVSLPDSSNYNVQHIHKNYRKRRFQLIIWRDRNL